MHECGYTFLRVFAPGHHSCSAAVAFAKCDIWDSISASTTWKGGRGNKIRFSYFKDTTIFMLPQGNTCENGQQRKGELITETENYRQTLS